MAHTQPSYFHLHLISDATGETLTTIAKAASVQYAQVRPIEHVHPLVRTQRQLERVLQEIESAPGIVLYTVVNEALQTQLEQRCRDLAVPCLHVLEPIMKIFESYLGAPKTPIVAGQHVLDADYFRRIDAQMQKLESAAQLLETQKRSGLTTEQAVVLGENIAALLPVYGGAIALYQAMTGESLSGKDLTAIERFFNGVAAAVPAGSAAVKLVNAYMTDLKLATSVGGIAADGTALMDFSQLTSQQKGVVGELLGATTVQNVLPGATRLGRMGEVGSQGIDDLYKVTSETADYVIVEYKFGTSALKTTADGVQMSDGWVLGTTTGRNRLADAVQNSVVADDIVSAFNKGRVEKWVVHTDPVGGTSVWIVDSAGKIAKADSDVTSKILGVKK